jgi:glycosyltransferase involved in cell wall biosynthesis
LEAESETDSSVRAAAVTKPITVCHPVWQLGRGGLERQLLQLLARLPADRFRHVLLVRGWTDELSDADIPTGCNVRVVREAAHGRDRFWALRLSSVLRENRVDVLHVRGLSMLVDSMLAVRMTGGVPLAFSFHGFEHAGSRFGPVRRRVYRAAARRCDARWAVSREAACAIAHELRMSPDEFGVVPNGVDASRYVPADDRIAVRRSLGLPDDRPVVLSVGNLKPIKGHAVLLRALGLMAPQAARVQVVLAGRDYLGGALQRWVRENKPDCDVRFVGEQEDVLPWYQAADLFVLPSRYEGLSNALLEAMACGLPVVATEVGGNRDVIEHNRTGLLVLPDNPAALGSALQRLLTDPGLRTSLGAAARRHVQTRFEASRLLCACGNRYEAIARRRFAASSRAGARAESRRNPAS